MMEHDESKLYSEHYCQSILVIPASISINFVILHLVCPFDKIHKIHRLHSTLCGIYVPNALLTPTIDQPMINSAILLCNQTACMHCHHFQNHFRRADHFCWRCEFIWGHWLSVLIWHELFMSPVYHINSCGAEICCQNIEIDLPIYNQPNYITQSILWLLMPWLLASPRHQQQWYWIIMAEIFRPEHRRS